MKKEVLVAISSKQRFEGCKPEQVDLVTRAMLYSQKGKYYVTYEESELTGMDGTNTTVKLGGNTVTLIRTGTFPSHMQFTQGERQVGLYETAAGALTISTYASQVKNDIGEDGGRLEIDYTIEIDSSLVGQHHFEMTVSPDNTN